MPEATYQGHWRINKEPWTVFLLKVVLCGLETLSNWKFIVSFVLIGRTASARQAHLGSERGLAYSPPVSGCC